MILKSNDKVTLYILQYFCLLSDSGEKATFNEKKGNQNIISTCKIIYAKIVRKMKFI
jgi:hypothetical protein